jgi:dTDP-4-amino-4,6-dideoxygalactose transaminase
MHSARHSYQAYIARAADRATRDHLLTAIRAQGVETQIGTYCVPQLTAYLDLGYDADTVPNAVEAADRGIALPLYESLTEVEQERVVQAVRTALGTAPIPSATS